MSPGRVRIQALSSGEFSVRSLVLDARYVTDPEGGPAPDPVTATTWGATSRAVDLGSGSERDTVLVVRENANDGWVATAGGAALRPVRGGRLGAGLGRAGGHRGPGRAALCSSAGLPRVLGARDGAGGAARPSRPAGAESPHQGGLGGGQRTTGRPLARRGCSGRDRWSCRGARSRGGTPGGATREVAPIGRGGGGRVRRPDVGRLGTGAAVARSGRLQPRRLVRRARAVPRCGGHDVGHRREQVSGWRCVGGRWSGSATRAGAS